MSAESAADLTFAESNGCAKSIVGTFYSSQNRLFDFAKLIQITIIAPSRLGRPPDPRRHNKQLLTQHTRKLKHRNIETQGLAVAKEETDYEREAPSAIAKSFEITCARDVRSSFFGN